MTPELQNTLWSILRVLEKYRGKILERGELWECVKVAAGYSMQSAMIHLKSRGVISHPKDSKPGKSQKMRWYISAECLEKFETALDLMEPNQ
jgi:hypothetical protein